MKTIGALVFFQLVLVCAACLPVFAAGQMAPTRDFGRVEAGQCLYTSLLQKKLSPAVIAQIIVNLDSHINFKRISPHTAYHFRLDANRALDEFAIEDGLDVLHMTHQPQGFVVQRLRMPPRTIMAVVTVRHENSSGRFYCRGEADSLAVRIQDILSRHTELGLQLHQEECFNIVVEKIYRGPVLLQYGHIQALELPAHTAGLIVRYHNDYYDGQGRSLKKLFLNVPLHYEFVSCNFMNERPHPILGGVRPHRGVDFAAPIGTPVWAIADGKVATAGWLTGYGLTVILRHAYGYESLYGHLSRFAPQIGPGATVRQKQVIGYIGTTGLSTGPHLHFGLTRDGIHLDPFEEDFPRANRLQGTALDSFTVKVKRMKLLLADESIQCGPPE